MFGSSKIRCFLAAVVVSAACLFIHPANASPLADSRPSPVQLAPRATGSPLGSECEVNADCALQRCATQTDWDPFPLCRRLPARTPCSTGDDCLSRSCLSGVCAASPIDSECEVNSDCISQRCPLPNAANLYSHFVCRRQPALGVCATSNDCLSRSCVSGACSASTIGGQCEINTDCVSRRCASLNGSDPLVCRRQHPKGRCTTGNDCLSRSCVSGTCAFSKYNGTCEINQDCAEGLCRSGKCVKSVVGDACYYDKECSGSQVCGPNSTCYVPGYRTLYPQDTCSYNYQCKNNRCVAGLKGSDQDDNQYEYGSYGAYELDRKRCDYNSLGEKGCRDYRDCTVGICRSNKCQLGFSGLDLCMKNQHCAGLCTSEGVCRDLPVNGTVADRQACTTSAQCNPATGDDCEIGWIGRPFPADRSQIHYVYDTICQYPGTDIE